MPYANVNNTNIYYEMNGSGDQPVVLIGGLGSQIQSWATQVPIYSERFRVVTFDNRGAGMSDKTDENFTIEDMADDTIALMDGLGIDRASFVGKSMGGMIAQWIGIKYPERIDKLVMGCSSASRDEVGNTILRIGRDIATGVGMKAVWLTALFLGYNRQYIEDNIESIQSTLQMLSDDPDSLRGYLAQSRACEMHDTRDLLGRISAKTLVMYGENDFITSPKRAAELGELIPDAVVKSFEGAGHGFWRERQAEVDSLVMDFLSGSLNE